MTYGGIPANGLRLIPNIHGERTMFSENWPNRARQWLPMIDHPYDKATGEFIVTAPAHYQVVANGLLVEEVGSRRRHAAHALEAVGADCVMALRARRRPLRRAPLRRRARHPAAGVGLSAGSRAGLPDLRAHRAAGRSSSSATWIGPYSYEKLAHVQAAGLGGGTEHASAIFYGEKGVASGRAPVVHEVAHQWWGNAVTEKDWDDVWLSEGFATYFTHLYTEQFSGRDAFVRVCAPTSRPSSPRRRPRRISRSSTATSRT